MSAEDPTPPPVVRPGLDADSADWVRRLSQGSGPEFEDAAAMLYEMLLRVARVEARRRGAASAGASALDEVAHQAASDAVVAITGKIGTFRGESRFTTWAYKFALLNVASGLGKLFRRNRSVPLEAEAWERLPDRLGLKPEDSAEAAELLAAVRRAVDEELTPRQRRVFLALVLNGMPIDEVAAELETSRNTVYKALFDARRKVRAYLEAMGYLMKTARRQA